MPSRPECWPMGWSSPSARCLCAVRGCGRDTGGPESAQRRGEDGGHRGHRRLCGGGVGRGHRRTCAGANARPSWWSMPVPPYRTSAVAASVAESTADEAAMVVPESRVMLPPIVAQIADHLDAVWTLDRRTPTRGWSGFSSAATLWTTARPTTGATPTRRSPPAPNGSTSSLPVCCPRPAAWC